LHAIIWVCYPVVTGSKSNGRGGRLNKTTATELSRREAASKLEILMPHCTDMQNLTYFQPSEKNKYADLIDFIHLKGSQVK